MFVVVLDTNALYGDFHLESRQALNLKDNLRALGGKLIIPEIVVDEAERKFDELSRESIRDLRRSIKRYRQLTGIDINILDILEGRGEQSLRQRLTEVADCLIPYPVLSHQQVVKRLLAGCRPFSGAENKGYRDFLIWLSVLQVATETNSTILFVTNNNNDFCNSKNNQLHEDLVADLREREIPVDQIIIVKSISSVNKDFLEERLNFCEVVLNDAEKKDFFKHIQAFLERNLLGEIANSVSAHGLVHVTITEFEEPFCVSIERTISTVAGIKQVTTRFTGNALVDILVPISDTKSMLEYLELRDLHVIRPDNNEDDEDEIYSLVYGYTKVSGMLIARLSNDLFVDGITIEKIEIDGIKLSSSINLKKNLLASRLDKYH